MCSIVSLGKNWTRAHHFFTCGQCGSGGGRKPEGSLAGVSPLRSAKQPSCPTTQAPTSGEKRMLCSVRVVLPSHKSNTSIPAVTSGKMLASSAGLVGGNVGSMASTCKDAQAVPLRSGRVTTSPDTTGRPKAPASRVAMNSCASISCAPPAPRCPELSAVFTCTATVPQRDSPKPMGCS